MDEKIINSIKGLSIDMINVAGSGHPGIALGAAPILYTLYAKHLNISLKDDDWINRDRFVLSAGHGSALLYSILFFAGYLSIDNLKKFRQINSLTPGHPEINTPGVDASTGPLGQGIANAVGMAIASKYYSKAIDESINYNTYVLCGDGDLMEGISYEAMSIAGNLNLNNLIVLYDSNNITLDGSTSISSIENVELRVRSMAWNYIKVIDGNSVEMISHAISLAKESTDKPTLIEIKTVIGNGSINENTNIVHGKPLSNEDILKLKEKLNLSTKPFNVDNKLLDYFQNEINNRTSKKYDEWKNISLNVNVDLNNIVPPFYEDMNESMRDTNSKIMNIISDNIISFIGGCADVASSTKAIVNNSYFSKLNYGGKNICYGIREHAMAGITNGIALSGLLPFASTFLSFSDYMKPSIRMSALMNLPVTYVFTHDSIMIGEDGPTHQPIEQLTMLRSIPNLNVYRPSDANEIVGAWNEIIKNKKPSAIVLSRGNVPLLKGSNREDVSKGAYIIRKEKNRLDGIIIATGSEVSIAEKIAFEFEKEKIYLRVVSMPSISLFESNDIKYKESLLPAGYKKIVIEYGSSYSWYKYVYGEKYLININTFGKSGKADDILSNFELDYESVKNRIKKILK